MLRCWCIDYCVVFDPPPKIDADLARAQHGRLRESYKASPPSEESTPEEIDELKKFLKEYELSQEAAAAQGGFGSSSAAPPVRRSFERWKEQEQLRLAKAFSLWDQSAAVGTKELEEIAREYQCSDGVASGQEDRNPCIELQNGGGPEDWRYRDEIRLAKAASNWDELRRIETASIDSARERDEEERAFQDDLLAYAWRSGAV